MNFCPGILARSFPYDETHTSRTKITAVFKLREALVRCRWLILLKVFYAWSFVEGEYTDCLKRASKVMGFASKGEIRTLMLNTGLSNWTKISNWQRNKYITWFDPTWPKYDSGNSEWKGRFVALLLFNSRTYTSGGGTKVKPNVGFKLNKLTVRSKS